MELSEILELLSGASDKQKQDLEALIAPSLKERIWVPNPGPQTNAFYSEADELFYGGQAGGGKALEINELLLTPFGFKRIGDARIGDNICATDGTIQKIIGVYPQPRQMLYEFTFKDGGKVRATADHIWTCWPTHKLVKKNGVKCSGKSAMQNYTTKMLIEAMSKPASPKGRKPGFVIPLPEPVIFNVAGTKKGADTFVKREVDPYLLGLILGDGHIGERVVSVSSEDEQILSYLQSLWPGGTRTDPIKSKGGKTKVVCFRGSAYSFLQEQISLLGLKRKRSHDKFIPRIYLHGSIPERWALLQGLMDTDGWVEDKRACYYTSVSRQLSDDVIYLARSLGGVASRTDRIPNFTYKGERKQGQRAYCVRLKFPEPSSLFRLTRKKVIADGLRFQREGRQIVSIEEVGKGDSVCIKVSNPNNLFITTDFIVTHNTDLLIGLALTEHKRSLILRRTNNEVKGLLDRMRDIVGNSDGLNSQTGTWRREDGRIIETGGCQLEVDKQKYKGNPHDGIFYDEVSDFTETQYTFINTWNRSAVPGQRCRVVAAGNPPTRPEGLWVVKRWAAWLDPQHPNPAEPGQLRWYTTGDDGEELEVDGPGPHMIGGRPVYARSRTFIPATLQDNPDLIASGYQASLDALPPELRAAYRDGDFQTTLKDDAYQIIPTSWVVEAQNRWKPNPPPGIPMCAMGVDVAIAKDKFVVACRHDGYYPKPLVIPGHEVSDPKKAAGRVVAMRRDAAKVIVDVGGGWGADCYAQLAANNIDCIGYMGVKGSKAKSSDGRFTFANVRTHALWSFREALDPSQPGGSIITLPPSATLRADLCAPAYQVKGNAKGATLQAESKQDVCDRLGRSTDEGDAVVMAWYDGVKQANLRGGWEGGRGQPVVNKGTRSSYIRRGR